MGNKCPTCVIAGLLAWLVACAAPRLADGPEGGISLHIDQEVSPEAILTPGTDSSTSPTVWPPVWSPDGHKEIDRQDRVVLTTIGVLTMSLVLYEDGTQVWFVEGRPYSVDPKPQDPCEPFWRDRDMIGPDGEGIQASEWSEPAWEEMPSQSPLCPGV